VTSPSESALRNESNAEFDSPNDTPMVEVDVGMAIVPSSVPLSIAHGNVPVFKPQSAELAFALLKVRVDSSHSAAPVAYTFTWKLLVPL